MLKRKAPINRGIPSSEIKNVENYMASLVLIDLKKKNAVNKFYSLLSFSN